MVFDIPEGLEDLVPVESRELLSESSCKVVYAPGHLSLFVFWLLLNGTWVADFVGLKSVIDDLGHMVIFAGMVDGQL